MMYEEGSSVLVLGVRVVKLRSGSRNYIKIIALTTGTCTFIMSIYLGMSIERYTTGYIPLFYKNSVHDPVS